MVFVRKPILYSYCWNELFAVVIQTLACTQKSKNRTESLQIYLLNITYVISALGFLFFFHHPVLEVQETELNYCIL